MEKTLNKKPKEIGGIGNYYGGLSIKVESGKPYWGIENYAGTDWEEIPDSLYDALVKFERSRRAAAKRAAKTSLSN